MIFRDLVAIPAIRPLAFDSIRSPQRSTQMANAIGYLFKQTNG